MNRWDYTENTIVVAKGGGLVISFLRYDLLDGTIKFQAPMFNSRVKIFRLSLHTLLMLVIEKYSRAMSDW